MTRLTIAMLSVTFFARILAAQDLDIDSLVGESWYGLYLNGAKSGWAMSGVAREGEDAVVLTEDAVIRVKMGTVRQDMRVYSKRVYGEDGALRSIYSTVTDPSGENIFECKVKGDVLAFKQIVGGRTVEEELPKPRDSLQDILKQKRLVGENTKVGDALTFSFFEPLYKNEFEGHSTVKGIEERMFEGARTKVFVISTQVPQMGIETTSYVAEDGTLLEDQTAGLIVMRLEPEQMAKDVNYTNDVIVANAAMLEKPIENPRGRETLRLSLEGPIDEDHAFNDHRQTIKEKADGIFIFEGKAQSDADLKGQTLPVTEGPAAEWTKATTFVQSDDERMIEKANEILDGETDAWNATQKLSDWVYDSVRKRFSARLTNSLEVLEHLEGDCTEHSMLFIGLARAAGLPAREVAGLVYVSDPQPGFFFHQWAKVWIGRWVDVDPTFDQPLADVTHIKLAEGDLLSQSKIIPIIGRIRVSVMK